MVLDMTTFAYAGRPGADLAGALQAFGTDWLYVAVPLAGFLAALAFFAWRAPAPAPKGFVRRASSGAARLTGLPAWCAGSLVITIGAFAFAVIGFFWDVAWHIDIGRDEFLFSPPHVHLLLGLSLLAGAGAVSILTATRDRADVGWRMGRWRVPFGGAALLVAGSAALVGFFVDELWHAAYGLDVTMWSPPHLTMISAAAVSPISAWLLLAEAGPGTGRRLVRRHLEIFLVGAVLIGLSAWQLEFDLGVPQWQHLYHPVLVAIAAGFGLAAARAGLGRAGALFAVARFVMLRTVFALLTAGVWGLSIPRFVPYVVAAIAVEAVFALTRRRTPLATSLLAGLAVGTLGLAGAWAFTQVWAWHPWQPAMFPRIGLAAAAAVAAAVLGAAFGRVVGYRPSGVRAPAVAASFLVLLGVLVLLLPRHTPDVTAHITTTPAGEGFADVAVRLDPADAAEDADWFEVMSWQGDGHQNAVLDRVGPGRYVARAPVPVDGEWKSILRLARGSDLGAIPIRMPADPEIDALAVPVAAERTAAFEADAAVLLREAHSGPAWPGLVGYGFTTTAMATVLGLLIAGTVALDRRRRGRGWTGPEPSLVGQRVILTGASGGIGAATRAALEAQGATVVGLDLHGDGAGTLPVDVRDPEAVRAAVDAAAGRLGGIDAVVANAGIGVAAVTAETPAADARAVMDVNFFGAWHVVAAAATHLPPGGHVVFVGSGLAVATVPFSAAYTASKRALVGLADVLRAESDGALHVGVVQPAYIKTAIHDGPRQAGVSLDGITRVETVADAAAAIVTVLETGRREIGSSPLTTMELWWARRFPAATERVLRRRWRRSGQGGVRPAATAPDRMASR